MVLVEENVLQYVSEETQDRGESSEDQQYYLNQSAHLLGNYHKYYTFHSVQSRTDLLKDTTLFSSLWESCGSPDQFVYLDIGCNEGDLTISVAQLIQNELPAHVEVIIVGVDLDHSLTQLANDKLTGNTLFQKSRFYGVDFTKPEEVVQFRQTLNDSHGIQNFHLISVFSTTMWIHINGGDDGLLAFLSNSRSFLDNDGVLLIEPQPTKCYRSAGKRCRKLGLAMPPYLNAVDKVNVNRTLTRMVIDQVGLCMESYLGTEDWGRPMLLFFNNVLFQANFGVKYPVPIEKISSVAPSEVKKSKNKKMKLEDNENFSNQ
jgi:hypothetical protein